MNKQLVKCLLDGLVPDRVGYYEVMEYLRNTVREKGSIRDLIHIMEELERQVLVGGHFPLQAGV